LDFGLKEEQASRFIHGDNLKSKIQNPKLIDLAIKNYWLVGGGI
jgi:hypothetical protein